MKKKELLFNYFLQKCVQKEQELLNTDDFKTGLLALILSHAHLYRHFAHGVTMSEIYFCKPFYAQELFIYLCFDALEYGDFLYRSFDFEMETSYRPGEWGVKAYEDKELTQYLDKIFEYPKSMSDVDCELYGKIIGDTSSQELLSKFYNVSNLRTITIDSLELPLMCPEVKMIDRAWNRLMVDENFIKMLTIGCKHNSHGRSYIARSYDKKKF